mmetsp:Transcript_6438/g.10294  ORF Transcript_6438/g.10294 Transcript_6438/m.10294 type:complete len:206 (-) Transcript_6438:375-992(-)
MAVRKAGATQLPGGAGLRARGGGHPPVAGGRLPAPDRRGRPLRQAAGGEAGGLRLCTAVLGRGPRPHPAGQALRLPGPSGRGELCHGGGPLRPGVRLPGAGAGHPLGEDGGGPAAGARPHHPEAAGGGRVRGGPARGLPGVRGRGARLGPRRRPPGPGRRGGVGSGGVPGGLFPPGGGGGGARRPGGLPQRRGNARSSTVSGEVM